MDAERAEKLLNAERRRVEGLLQETLEAGSADREAANEPGDMADPTERLVAEVYDDDVAEGLRERLEAIVRAQHRLAEGTYGKSIRSGMTIPDERLEADPAAELTVEEAGENH
jgi:DnaK suppressor protein